MSKKVQRLKMDHVNRQINPTVFTNANSHNLSHIHNSISIQPKPQHMTKIKKANLIKKLGKKIGMFRSFAIILGHVLFSNITGGIQHVATKTTNYGIIHHRRIKNSWENLVKFAVGKTDYIDVKAAYNNDWNALEDMEYKIKNNGNPREHHSQYV
jgi:hypothetical protein